MYMATPGLMNLSLRLNICFHDDVEKFTGYKPSPNFQAGGGGGGGGGQDKPLWTACPPLLENR